MKDIHGWDANGSPVVEPETAPCQACGVMLVPRFYKNAVVPDADSVTRFKQALLPICEKCLAKEKNKWQT